MPKVKYGTQTIDYQILEKAGLQSHYITVQKGEGVTLKGEAVSPEKAQQLILKKAPWIMEKLALVRAVEEGALVTGSRMTYLGRRYYVQIIEDIALTDIRIEFTASKFNVFTPPLLHQQVHLRAAFADFMRAKAKEKISPRVKKLAIETGLTYQELKFRKLEKRWGSCTASNNIIINVDAIKLPFSLIDYLIVHELVHTKIKNHSKEFWAELSKHIVNWKELDKRMQGMML